MKEKGQQKLKSSIEPLADTDAVEDLAEEICARWESPQSAPLARALLTKSTLDMKPLMNMDSQHMAIIVGVAAAAAVSALVIVVRRGRNLFLHSDPTKKIEPSANFSELMRIAQGDGEVAMIAACITSKVTEPWSWRLKDGLRGLSSEEKRSLLSTLAEHGLSGVSVFAPKAGDKFNESRMSTMLTINTDDIWVVANNTPDHRRGYCLDGRVEVHAEVEVCTADWWVLSSAGCAVGQMIIERAEELIAGGHAKRMSWRAPWGFTFPEDLRGRTELTEIVLDKWRQRMIDELNPYYPDRGERQLTLVGSPGEPFDSSMETQDGRNPIGDTVVSEVVLRDGVQQYGLGCPGGSPLLLAVVCTQPARSNI